MSENSINKILWDDNRPLSWGDFQSTEFAGPPDFMALAKVGIDVKWKADLSSTEPCQFVFTSIVARGSFHINESWVKEMGRNPEGLRHEQGHFDIAEIFARQFNASAKEYLMNKSHTCPEINGRSAEQRKAIYAHSLIRTIYDTIHKSQKEMQQMYEEQTDHGRLSSNQLEFEQQIISPLLKQFEPHKAT